MGLDQSKVDLIEGKAAFEAAASSPTKIPDSVCVIVGSGRITHDPFGLNFIIYIFFDKDINYFFINPNVF